MMIKVIFDQHGRYAGVNRESMSGEKDIYLDMSMKELENLTIQKQETEYEEQFDARGNRLYVLETVGGYETQMKRTTTTEYTDEPVYEVVIEHYEKDYTPEERQLRNLIPEGPIYESEEVHRQVKDTKGNPLFYTTQEMTVFVPSKKIKEYITQYDPRWTELLPVYKEEKEFTTTTSFGANPFLFTFEYMVGIKKERMKINTFSTSAHLIEIMKPDKFDQLVNVSMSENQLYLHPGANCLTKPIGFDYDTDYVKLFLNASGPLMKSLKVGSSMYLFNASDEVVIQNSKQKEVQIYLENTSDKTIIVESIGVIA